MKKWMILILSLAFIFASAGCGKETAEDLSSVTFEAKLLEIGDNYFLVEPVEGSSELKSADRITVPTTQLDPSAEPEVGDIVEIEYNGEIAESYPAQISEVYSIKVVENASEEADDYIQ